MSRHELALTTDNAASLYFEEEMAILRITYGRIFRSAVISDLSLPEAPDIEAEVIAEHIGHAQLNEAHTELDEALDGTAAIDRELTKWREELDAQREELGIAA